MLKPTAANLQVRRPRRVTGVASYEWMGCNRSFSARCWVRCPPDLDCSHWIGAASKFNRLHFGIISFVKRALKSVPPRLGECDDVCTITVDYNFWGIAYPPDSCQHRLQTRRCSRSSHSSYQPLSLVGNRNDSFPPILVPCTRRRCLRQRFLRAGLPARCRSCQNVYYACSHLH